MEYYNKTKRKPIPAKLRHQVFVRDGYRCVECGATNKETTLEIDHIIPVSKGGTNDIDNLQTLCKTCNRKKRDHIWDPIKSREIQIKQYKNRIKNLKEKLKYARDDEEIEIKYKIVKLEEAIIKLEQDIERYIIKAEKEKLYKKLYVLDWEILSKIFIEFGVDKYNNTKEEKIKIILHNSPSDRIEDLIKKYTNQLKLENYLYNLDSTIFNILTKDLSSNSKEQKIKILIEENSLEKIKKDVKKIENKIDMINNIPEKRFNILCMNLNAFGSSKIKNIENLLKNHTMNRIQKELTNIKRNDEYVQYLMTLPDDTINELSLKFNVPCTYITKEDKCYYITNRHSKMDIGYEIYKINEYNKFKEYLKLQSDDTINKLRLRLQIPQVYDSKDIIIDYLLNNFSLDEIKYEINFNKEEKLRLIKKYSELGNMIIYKLDNYFPELTGYNEKKDKINYLVENYSYIIIDERVNQIKLNIEKETNKFKLIFDKLMKKTQEKTFEHFSIIGFNRKEILFNNFSLNEINNYIKDFEREYFYPIFYNEIDEKVLSIIFEEFMIPPKLNSKKEKLDYLFNENYVNRMCDVINAINKKLYPTYCPKCLNKLRKDDNFCPYCAYEVKILYNEHEKKLLNYYCPNCLNKIMSSDKFCPYCGYNLDPSITENVVKSFKDFFKF